MRKIIVDIIIIWLIFEVVNHYYYTITIDKISKKRFIKKSIIPLKYFLTKSFKYNILNYFCTNKDNKVTLNNIYVNNFKKLIAYYSFKKTLRDLTQSENNKIDEVINSFEKKNNIKLHTGINTHIYCLRLGLVKLNPIVKPLFVYAIFRFLRYYLEYTLFMKGFISKTINKFVFFYPKNINSNGKRNIIFNHGIGIGIIPYMKLITKYMDRYNFILVNLPNISNLYFHSYLNNEYDDIFPSPDIIRDTYFSLLCHLKLNNVDMMSHSGGALIAGVLDNSRFIYNRIKRRILIEPVSFFHSYAKSFNNAKTVVRYNSSFLHKLIASDIYTQYLQYRWSGWTELINNKRDFDKSCDKKFDVVLLNSHDSYTDYNTLIEEYSYCFKKIFTINDYKHGDIFQGNLKIFDELFLYYDNLPS